MPSWWGKKPSKKKPTDNNNKPKSFDEVFSPTTPSRNSPSSSNNPSSSGSVPGGFSGFSGFDSDNGERRGHPLPRPALPQTFAIDNGVSGSGSVSSVSSSGSSDDHPVAAQDQEFGNFRGLGNVKIDMRSRSPGPRPRGGSTSPTLPLHQRLCGFSLDSPDGKSQCHKLPLPPGSPTSPNSSLMNVKSIPAGENLHTQSKWKKGKLLGRGTFGHVYLGFNSISGQMCAIKEVRVVSDDNSSKECLRQLNQEINLLSQLSHPNIVQYYGSEMGDEALSVYLEYVSGGSIHKLVQEYGPLKEPVIQNYTRKIVSGLAYLHGRNTVHRDIKGANILVDPNGEIKLADFGMAKHITNCTSMLSFKGSPYWMAPELVMNANGYSLAVDIWSLGCTVIEMATSKPPWYKYEGVAAIFKIGNSKELPEIPDHLSNDAKHFVKFCLQRCPEARPTASQLLDHPFLRDQSTNRVAHLSHLNFSMDAFSHSLDGSQTPLTLDHCPRRKSTSTCDREYPTSPLSMTSQALISPRENVRTITSLPVSPCSSPLQNHRPTYNSCFVSTPPHSNTLTGQSRYDLNNFSSYMTRPNMATFNLDPWIKSPVLKAQTPGGSPRRRLD